MGMFNSIYVCCPKCDERVEFQTKSGSCILKSWNYEDAPNEELRGIINDSWPCRNGHAITIKDGSAPEPRLPLHIEVI